MIRTLRVGCYVLAVLVALAVGTVAALAAAALLATALAVRPFVRSLSAGHGLTGQALTGEGLVGPGTAQAAGTAGQGSTTLSTHV